MKEGCHTIFVQYPESAYRQCCEFMKWCSGIPRSALVSYFFIFSFLFQVFSLLHLFCSTQQKKKYFNAKDIKILIDKQKKIALRIKLHCAKNALRKNCIAQNLRCAKTALRKIYVAQKLHCGKFTLRKICEDDHKICVDFCCIPVAIRAVNQYHN